MQVKIYLLGHRDDNSTLMSAVIRPEEGKLLVANKILEGYSVLESKATAVGWVLNHVQDRYSFDSVTVYTDDFMQEIAEYENDKYKSCSKLLKKYTDYIKKIRKKYAIVFSSLNTVESEKISNIHEIISKCKKRETISGNIFQDKQKSIPSSAWGNMFSYSITILKPDGTVFGSFDEKTGFDGKRHAAWFAGWYIKESKDPKSIFYNYQVILNNISPIFEDI